MQNERTKMCPACDGCVSLQTNICPYCGSNFDNRNFDLPNLGSKNMINPDLSNPDTSNLNSAKKESSSLTYEETLSSLYPPPYKPKVIQTNNEMQNENFDDIDKDNQSEKENEENDIIEDSKKSSLIPIVVFWLGVNIFIFSIILIAFSKDGVLYLKWNTKYWFLYSFLSIPLLYFGFKGLQNLED